MEKPTAPHCCTGCTAKKKVPDFSGTFKCESSMRFLAGSPSWTRTNDNSVNSRVLYRLSYGGISLSYYNIFFWVCQVLRCIFLVFGIR